MSPNTIDILKILGVCSVISTVATLLFHHLSLKRQFLQDLNHKMIDRISYLVEHYYEQISSSSEGLRHSLAIIISADKSNTQQYYIICFCSLILYLFRINKLREERPRPLFTQLEAEQKYIYQINNIYDNIPFTALEISYIIHICSKNNIILPFYQIENLLTEDDNFANLFYKFETWLEDNLSNNKKPKNKLKIVISSCYSICEILEDQIKKLYRLWYIRRIKKSSNEDYIYK